MKLFLFIGLMFFFANAYAALNKWVDSNGKVHYSDARPSDAKVQTIKSLAAPESEASSNSAPAVKSLAEREMEWKKSQQEKEKSEKKATLEKENEAIKQKNCSNSRSNLAGLENSRRLVTFDEKGERSFVDEAGRAQKIEEARKAINTYCN